MVVQPGGSLLVIYKEELEYEDDTLFRSVILNKYVIKNFSTGNRHKGVVTPSISLESTIFI